MLPSATDLSLALQTLRSTGALSEVDQQMLCTQWCWNEQKQAFTPSRAQLANPAFWSTLFMFWSVLEYRDTQYPQKENNTLDAMRFAVLPLLATDNRWRTQYLAQGYDPHVLVVTMLQSLWVRGGTPALPYAEAALHIFNTWTRRRLTLQQAIGALEEKITRTLFGEPWWLLQELADHDGPALYHVIQEERPPFLSKWLPASVRPSNAAVLPAGLLLP